MRTCFVLLLTIIALLATINAVSGSTIKLRAPENPTQVETISERVLQGSVKTEETIDTDGEERNALTNIVAKLGSNTNAWFTKMNLKLNSHFVYSEKIAQELMKKNLTPDDVFTMLKLGVRKNAWKSNGGHTAAYKLWQNYFFSFKDVNSRWSGKFQPGQLKV